MEGAVEFLDWLRDSPAPISSNRMKYMDEEFDELADDDPAQGVLVLHDEEVLRRKPRHLFRIEMPVAEGGRAGEHRGRGSGLRVQ